MIDINWRRVDRYEKRGERRAAVRAARKHIRQSTRLQLEFTRHQYNTRLEPIEFMHPAVRLEYFD